MRMNFLVAAMTVAIMATGAANAKTVSQRFDATSAVGKGSDHSLWIQPGVGGFGQDFDFMPAGRFSVYNDGTANLNGSVQAQNRPANEIATGFKVNFDFDDSFPDRLATDPTPSFKSENSSTPASDLVLTDMVGGTLIGFGLLQGLDLTVTRKPANYVFATQYGSAGSPLPGKDQIGPNNKNANFGMAFWMTIDFARTCTLCGHYANLKGAQGDINVDLAPVPLPAGAVLMLTGFGIFAGLRRRRRTS